MKTDVKSSSSEDITRTVARITAEFTSFCSAPLAPALYLVATPIGNLGDISLRALSVLMRADKVYCEDTRHSIKLFNHYGIRAKLDAYHDHNGDRLRPRIMKELAAGLRVALISDAGTPMISDPGFKLGQAAVEAGHKIISLPGPTAAITALTSSGLPTDRFQFAGFLPAKTGARRTMISEMRDVDAALIFFESPGRLSAALEDFENILGDRDAVVARELTKMHEEIKRGRLSALCQWAEGAKVKGEITIIIAPGGACQVTDAEIVAMLDQALQPRRLKDAARDIAEELGVPRKRVYELGLKHMDKK